jgi:predicted RNA-binding protein YlxR (DUF448 family)
MLNRGAWVYSNCNSCWARSERKRASPSRQSNPEEEELQGLSESPACNVNSVQVKAIGLDSNRDE